MPVDNKIYDKDANLWWQDDNYLSLLKNSVNPTRHEFFLEALDRFIDPERDVRLLDVGCGGGYLAEAFAGGGCRVVGFDPSVPTIRTARLHTLRTGLRIDYGAALGEHLPFNSAEFDAVACCDVLEHVDDLDQVVSEASRVLKPGGLFFFDTINRTFLSWLAIIKISQDWRLTAFFPPRTHAWSKFIRPGELGALMRRYSIEPGRMVGMVPRLNPFLTLAWLIRIKAGRASFKDFGEANRLEPGESLAMNYMGFGVKNVR